MIVTNMMRFVHLVSFLILLCFHLQHKLYAATDSILPGQQISYPETIISAWGVFELGFFAPGNSNNYYVGIWYKKVPELTVVWVANRDHPVSRTSAVLTINTDGNLVISDRQLLYMVTNTTTKGNTSATLLDSGNLILKDLNSIVSWQSFDYPSHVFLPGMKLGINKRTGSALSLVSWKSTDDPGSGAFSLKMDEEQNSQFFIMQGTQKYWASGLWDGKMFSKIVPEMQYNYYRLNLSYTSNENESYFTYSLYNPSIISTVVMDVSGQVQQLIRLESSQQWNLFQSQPRMQCDVHASCGSFGVCNQEILSPCQCLFGFEPHSSEAWRQKDRSGGCIRKVPLQCENTTALNGEEDKFLKISNMKYPANGQQFVVGSSKECNFACLSNCSCSAYAYDGSGGCSIWTGGLLNLQQLQAEDKYGKTIYVKLAASELPGSGGNKKLLFFIIPVVASLLLGCYFSCQWRNKRKQKGNMEPGQNILLFDMGLSTSTTNNELSSNKAIGSGKSNDSGLPLFTFASVSAATDDFSAKNKLGEGGFGPVYKGKLLKGHEIAVKRLSKKSGQGLEELKNEVMLIAKLQHRNLVKLLGCCLEQEEKILIYEYMPNKSLDTFLFDPAKRGLLDWRTRVRIVEGIAQGLLYLHQYSRLKIIHRDLKASNILLDADMNPKISDFGMARIFGGNETQANTKRISGTYGYMAPEYALQGIFSEKSDVFSFGVLLLEIVSGKKNTGFYLTDSLNLLGYAWDLWKDDRALDLMDPVWEAELSKNLPLRYIHVALLCVQEIAAYRPIMSEVVSMLTNQVTVLPSPEQPAFSDLRSLKTLNAPMGRAESYSKNEVTVSLLKAR